MSSARSVAKELVRLSLSGPVPDPLTPYRLQALLYYAQAWSLVLRDSELFPDDIQGTADGPSVPAVAAAIEECPESRLVCSRTFDQDPRVDAEDETVFLEHLWMAYGYFSPSGLLASIENEPPFLKRARSTAVVWSPRTTSASPSRGDQESRRRWTRTAARGRSKRRLPS